MQIAHEQKKIFRDKSSCVRNKKGGVLRGTSKNAAELQNLAPTKVNDEFSRANYLAKINANTVIRDVTIFFIYFFSNKGSSAALV